MAIYSKLNSKIRIADLGGVSNRTVEFLQSEDLTPYTEYKQIVSHLQQQAEALTMAMDRNDMTSELVDLDAARDEALSNLSRILKGYASISLAEVGEPARRLLNTFNKYGLAIAHYRYDAESGKIQSLLKDLGTPEAVADIAALAHVDVAINALSEAQQAFEKKKIAYDAALEFRRENIQSASDIKPHLLDAINDQLVNYHLAMVQFKDAHFKHIADTIDGWIKDANRN